MSVAKGLGLEFDLLDAAEAKRRNPLLDTSGVLAALGTKRMVTSIPRNCVRRWLRDHARRGPPFTGTHQ